jgi:hypothetical protein
LRFLLHALRPRRPERVPLRRASRRIVRGDRSRLACAFLGAVAAVGLLSLAGVAKRGLDRRAEDDYGLIE